MHIPDAVLAPSVAAATGAIAAAGFAAALRKLGGSLRDRTTVLMGVVSAFVFAAQMVNFPVGPLPVSGHLLGGVLAAVTLGPWAGAAVIGTVLVVQCLLFGDGGLTALGANFVNLGLIGSVGGYAIYAPIRRALDGRRGVLIGAMVAAWFSVILASVAFAIELGMSGGTDAFLRVLTWIVLVHAAIGLGEAILTGLVLRFVLLARPDFIYDADFAAVSPVRRWGEALLGGLGVAVAVAVFLAPFASEAPDGLEAVGHWFGFLAEEAPPAIEAPIADYQLPGGFAPRLATALAGLVGTLVVSVVAIGLARAFARESTPIPAEVETTTI